MREHARRAAKQRNGAGSGCLRGLALRAQDREDHPPRGGLDHVRDADLDARAVIRSLAFSTTTIVPSSR